MPIDQLARSAAVIMVPRPRHALESPALVPEGVEGGPRADVAAFAMLALLASGDD